MAVRRNGTARNGALAALDVGTSKVCCFIARADSGRGVRVTGIGHQASSGLNAGAVADIEGVEQSIRAAVEAAERMAGHTVHEVLVNISAGLPTSHRLAVEVAIGGREVGETDVGRALAEARGQGETDDREVVHTIPVGYAIDGAPGIHDPRGMYGSTLGVDVHLVTAAQGALRNLVLCVERGHLEISRMVYSAYASGLATLVEDEMNLGATLLDMGGGTTSIAVFCGGSLAFADSVRLGGQHVTNDVARGLATSCAHAERIKTLYGSTTPGVSDEREIIDVPLVGEEDDDAANHVPRSMLVGIIRPRLEETFELIRDRLEAASASRLAGRRVVLTGGASQLQGVRELAARVLDKQVRLGRPIRIDGLAEATGGPAFATCAGLLAYATRESFETAYSRTADDRPSAARLARLGRWLRESF